MAASRKYDLSSSSSDGPTHSTGHRGPHAAASLERPRSFREAADNRISSSLPSSSRNGSMSSQGGVTLLQSLVSDLKGVFDQKSPRPEELKRSISSILGISQEDSLPATVKPLTSSSVEEIRCLRINLHESSAKARDRAKAFHEAALRIDKCCSNLSRKRSRNDNSSSDRSNLPIQGRGILKMGPQSLHTTSSPDIGIQKSEERKTGAPNRKIRSSLLEMDVRGNSIARLSSSMDKDRDVFKLVNSGATPPDEKGRALTTAVDGWEKSKMKKKRSAIKSDASGNAISVRPVDGDRGPKRATQQKLMEPRSRSSNKHGFRSGSANGNTVAANLDSASQQTGVCLSHFLKNDQDNASLPSDRRDRLVDKDGAILNAASRPNNREENYAASPTSVVKMNTSARGSRSNSGSLSRAASPNKNTTPGNSDDWEHPNSTNKFNGAVGDMNRKRSASARSSSPPVVNWGGQKLQKKTRVARRSILTPVVSTHDDYPASDIMDSVAVNDDRLRFSRRRSNSASQHSKSESEESGVVDNKPKVRNRKCSEIENGGSCVQKVGNLVLPSRKNKLSTEEDPQDSVWRHGNIGKNGNGDPSARSGISVLNEKVDRAATAKQMKSGRINNKKIESKPVRPPPKKLSERKGLTRQRHSVKGRCSLEFAESDDHEDLLAAANAAISTCKAYIGPFWEQNKDVFGFLSAEDQEFLNRQIHIMDEDAGSACGTDDGQSLKGDMEHNLLPPTPALSSRDGYDASPNGTISLNDYREAKTAKYFLDELVLGNEVQVGVSICQALLSAIIQEEEIENVNHKDNNEEDWAYENAYGHHVEVNADLNSESSDLQSFGTFQGLDRPAVYSYKPNTGWGYHDELVQEELASNCTMDSTVCSEYQYNQMCMNDRILLELSEIGIYPESMPSLAQSEDADIDEGLNRLTVKHYDQVLKKRRTLLKLDDAVRKAREFQQRELEQIALDKLVGSAYEKYMACWGPNASGGKNMNKTNKQATLAFVKRALAQCRRFEETGSCCFSEAPFRNIFSSVGSRNDVSVVSQPSTDRSHGLVSQSAQREDTHKYYDAFRSVNHLIEPKFVKEDQWSNKLKKKELLLDEVVSSATGILGGSLVSGTKGKRSESDRDSKGQTRDSASRTGSARNVKGERKNKSKPKQKLTQLSDSVNGLLNKATETTSKIMHPAPKLCDNIGGGVKKDDGDPPSNCSDTEPIDFSHLQLPEIDVTDFGVQGQDIGSWLNIEEDGLQDHDFMGLEIPMDDLSGINMML